MARTIATDPSIVILKTPAWMNRPWLVRIFDPGLGVAYHDTLLFTTAGKVKVVKNGHAGVQTHAQAQTLPQDWAKSCQLTAAGLSGFTMNNLPFLITYNSATGHLTCTVAGGHAGPGSAGKMPGPGGTWVAEDGGVGGPPKDTGPTQR
jgi:hypothetical protein